MIRLWLDKDREFVLERLPSSAQWSVDGTSIQARAFPIE